MERMTSDLESRSHVLQMENVDVLSSFAPAQRSVQDVNWEVGQREFWVIGGLLASGKTDFMLTASGVLPPVRGVVRHFGVPVHGDVGAAEESLHERLRVGLVHDGGLMLRHLTIAENIALPLLYHHNASFADVESKVKQWLEEIGMEDQAMKQSSQVNRNWAQRAGLARACILNPEVLLLDNPLTGLDPQHVRWWIQIIEALSRGHRLMNLRPMTVIVSCDDFRPWVSPGRRYAILRNRKLDCLDPNTHPERLALELLETPPLHGR